jgi:hypothetical protein
MSSAGEKILGSIREARAVLRGEAEGKFVVHVPETVDVAGSAPPEGAARAFLKAMEREPAAARRALLA